MSLNRKNRRTDFSSIFTVLVILTTIGGLFLSVIIGWPVLLTLPPILYVVLVILAALERRQNRLMGQV